MVFCSNNQINLMFFTKTRFLLICCSKTEPLENLPIGFKSCLQEEKQL